MYNVNITERRMSELRVAIINLSGILRALDSHAASSNIEALDLLRDWTATYAFQFFSAYDAACSIEPSQHELTETLRKIERASACAE